jgi:hypothetical protein
MAKLDNIGMNMSLYIDEITYTHVEVSPEVVATIKAQGRNWQPALVIVTGYVDGDEVYQCVSGHEIISAVKEAGLERVSAIPVPNTHCI